VTLLGESQWRWLEEQSHKPAEIRLDCSGTQIVNDTKGMQERGNFPHERTKLFELIQKTDAQGIVLLSGTFTTPKCQKLMRGRNRSTISPRAG